MLESILSPPITFRGNNPLTLDDPETAWFIASGCVTIFATRLSPTGVENARRYLFNANAGDILVGISGKIQLLAVALDQAQLRRLPMKNLLTLAIEGDREVIELLNRWLTRLDEDSHLPLYENLENCAAHIASRGRSFFDRLEQIEKEEREEQFQRFLTREKLTDSIRTSALARLASLAGPEFKETNTFVSGSPLLTALGAIGRVQGIDFQAPHASENRESIEGCLEAIARSSQCRFRRTLLRNRWWRSEHGPLLGFLAETNTPVALLPHRERGSTYRLFNPLTGISQPVTAHIAATLTPTVYTFYPALPPGVTSPARLFWYAIRGYHRDFLGIILLGVIGTLFGMITPAVTAILIDRAIPNGDRSLLIQLGILLLTAAFGGAIFKLSEGLVTLRVEKVTDVNLQLTVWDRLLRLAPGFFRRYDSGNLIDRLIAIREIRSQLSGSTLRTLLTGVFSLLNLGLMFFYSSSLALVGFILSLVIFLFTLFSSVLILRRERVSETLEGEIYGLTLQLLGGIPKIRVACAEERAFAAWAEQYARKIRLNLIVQTLDDRLTTFNEALPLLSSVLIFWFAASSLQSGSTDKLTLGSFLAFNAAFASYLAGAIGLSNTVTDILRIIPLWERAKVIVQSPPESNPNQTHPGILKGGVKVDNVSFRYRDYGPLILEGVTLSAEPGEFIAIVGLSGSGKSTIFRLLLGFEKPLSGAVYYDGQDLSALDLCALRRQLGVVLQNARIMQNSIFDNITGGGIATIDRAWEAARMAGIAEEIERLPMGMDTIINEGGGNLSGGQRQRLLIARALVNEPKIILMDEATSALDNATQAIVTESLERLKATRIVIAHRLSTIRQAERIYVLDGGRIVQVGSFDELRQQGGLFTRLIARQLE